ncbi:MAG: phage tail tape measure C-terminal domain-containing protein [Synergistaceae bacterium]
MSDIPIKITVETSDVTRAARKSEREMDRIERKAKKTGASMGKSLSTGFSSFMKTAGLVAGAAAVGAAIFAVGKNILDINRKFESLTMQLKTFLGDGEKAKQMFKAIKDFAAPLPMTVEETTQAVIRMMSLGLRPTEAALTSFGNIAAGTNKTIMQFTEAVADAVVGEYERLKEFGIKARVEGDKVALTFGGVTTRIGRDAQSMQDYLEELGRTKFAGAMANQATTVNGAISVLKSSWDNLADTLLNDEAMSFIAKAITWVADVTTKFTEGLKYVPNFWTEMWLRMERAVLEFYSNIAPVVDAWRKLVGTAGDYTMTEAEAVNARLKEIQGEMVANANDAMAKFNAGHDRKKIDDFTDATKKAAGATTSAADAAKKASEKQRALDAIMKLLHPDTAEFVVQMRELKTAYDKGYISLNQYNTAMAKLQKMKEEAANKQRTEDQGMIANIIDPDLAGFQNQMKEVDAALARGTISVDQYAAAVKKLQTERQKIVDDKAQAALASSTVWIDGAKRGLDGLVKKYEDSAATIENALTSAFQGAEDALVKFVKTGKLDFSSLVDSMLEQMLRMSIQQQILAPLAGWMSGASSSASGGLTGLVQSAAKMMGFASGGSFTVSKATAVGSSSGTDNRIVAFRARDGERVSVDRNGTGSGSGSGVSMTVVTKDADSFKRSQGQIMSRASALMGRAAARNN